MTAPTSEPLRPLPPLRIRPGPEAASRLRRLPLPRAGAEAAGGSPLAAIEGEIPAAHFELLRVYERRARELAALDHDALSIAGRQRRCSARSGRGAGIFCARWAPQAPRVHIKLFRLCGTQESNQNYTLTLGTQSER